MPLLRHVVGEADGPREIENMKTVHGVHVLRVLEGHRITIPSGVMKKLGIDVGDYVIAQLETRFEDTSWKIVPAEVRPREPKT